MRAIVIDPAARELREVVVDRPVIRRIVETLGGAPAAAIHLRVGDRVYVGDIHEPPDGADTFRIGNAEIAGNGFIIGIDESGDYRPAATSLEAAAAMIGWGASP